MGRRGPEKDHGGRPSVEFNWARLDYLCQKRMSLIDCAEIMEISDSTIQRRIKEKFGLTFELYRDKKMAVTRLSLIEMALERAKAGNIVMHIFLLKNLCGMADKVESAVEDKRLTKDFVITKLNGDQEILKAD